jgi:hypothetical protein
VPPPCGEKCELAGHHEDFRDITHARIRINLDNLLSANDTLPGNAGAASQKSEEMGADAVKLTTQPDVSIAAASRPARLPLIAAGLIMLAGAFAAVAILLAINPAFFFYDDMQHQHLPVMMEIGQRLRAGEFPAMTPLSEFGGNLLGEYQYGVCNPVSLLIYLALPSFSNLAAAAAFLAISHYLILAAGVFVLVLELGGRPFAAALAAVMMVTNPFLAHWFASAWLPGLIATAWFPWAIAAAHRSSTDARVIPFAAVAVYLLNASGWPHAVVAMGITVLVIFLLDPTIPRRQLHGGWFAVLAGCLASIPVWLPLLAFSAMGTRVSYFSDLDGLFAPPLQSLLNPGFPSQVFMLNGLNGWERSSIPILFAGIPVLIVPALVRPQWWRSHLRDLACWLCVAATFLVLTMGPSQMGPLRWSFRFLPYFHLALCILTAMLVSHAQFDRSRAALWRALACCAAGFFIAWQVTTGEQATHELSLVLLVVCTLIVWRLLARPRTATIALIAMTLLTWAFVSTYFQRNTNLHELGAPLDRTAYELPPTVSRDDVVLTSIHPRYIKQHSIPSAGVAHGVYSGDLGMLAGMKAVNGYSPIGPAGLVQGLCMNQFGWTCWRVAEFLNRVDPGTGLMAWQLQGITRVIVDKTDLRERLDRIDGANVCHDDEYMRVYCLPRRDLITWSSKPISYKVLDASATKVRISVTSGTSGADVVLARTWYPGLTAQFNGMAVQSSRYLYDLVRVELPESASGVLEVRWGYPHVMYAWIALAACLLTIVLGLRAATRSPAS